MEKEMWEYKKKETFTKIQFKNELIDLSMV